MPRPHRLNGGEKPHVVRALGDTLMDVVASSYATAEIALAGLRVAESWDPTNGLRGYAPEQLSVRVARIRGLRRALARLEAEERESGPAARHSKAA